MTRAIVTTWRHENISPRGSVPREASGCRLLKFEAWPHPNDYLFGHRVLHVAGWQIHHVPHFRRRDGTLSVGVPNALEVDRDGVQLRDDSGKRKYASLMSFSGDGKARWERAVLGGLSDTGIVL